jgi:ABC-type branched-subunit amino acid transport system ATPase component/MFS family permease
VTDHDATRPPSLRATLRSTGASWYPLVALGLLAIVDTFHSYAFSVLSPDISRTLGIDKSAFAGLIALKTVAVSLAPLPAAALVQRHPRRALLCIVTGIVWSAVAIATGWVTLAVGLGLVLVVDGLSTGSVAALHQPLLLDSYPSSARVRVLSAYQNVNSIGNVLAPLLVAALSVWAALAWRGVFVALGAISLLAALLAARLRDPGIGHTDAVELGLAEVDGVAAVDRPDTSLGFFEIVRQVALIPTVRRLLGGFAVLGVMLIPYQTFLFFFLEERWDFDAGQRGLFFAYLGATAIVAITWFARRGEQSFSVDPGSLLTLAGAVLAGAVALIALGGASPWLWPMIACFGAGSALIAVLTPALYTVLLSVVPAETRPHVAALAGIFLGGVGGLAGALFLSGIDDRFGITGSIVALLVPGLGGAALIASARGAVQPDLDRLVRRMVEDEEHRSAIAAGRSVPLLACRSIDFSYDALQVLFDVDLTVDDGEMVALLGVNGAGKSTLLKVISGIGLPSGGSVRLDGADITYVDPERRVELGITQIPGGRAVFGPLSVVDNLRAYGYQLGRDGARLDRELDRCFEAFPRLAERRNQAAATLSGGEQQMLALSKALILRPRLLLIDELSLGLAPVVVGQLLEMVREINQAGTAVVLVEQSVNIALNLVDHAYFMEKGEVRFDGPAAELLDREDLLRAVFLQGASAAGAPT